MADQIKVVYGCDMDGDYTVPITECVDSKEKTFNSFDEAVSFINKCSYVYNLDELLSVKPSLAPKVSKKVLLIEG